MSTITRWIVTAAITGAFAWWVGQGVNTLYADLAAKIAGF